MPVIQEFSWGYNQSFHQGCDYLRAPLGRTYCKGTHLAVGYFQTVTVIFPEKSASWHRALSIGLFIASHPISPSVRGSKGERERERVTGCSRGSHNVFLINLRSENTFVMFYSLEVSYLVVSTLGGISQRHEYQDGGPLKDCLPQ